MGKLRDWLERAAAAFGPLGGILTSLGGALTALAVAVVGIYGSNVLDRSRARETDVQLYAQLMSKREDAETLLRKDMFNSIIGSFLKTTSTGYPYEQQVLNLELLAYNFHEALDLAPLFKHVFLEIHESHDPNAGDYMRRLERVADEVKSKQIAALEESGGKLDASLNLNDFAKHLDGVPVMDGEITPHSDNSGSGDPAPQKTYFKVTATSVDKIKREIRVKLEVRQPGGNANLSEVKPAVSIFNVSPFDFPMIDNTRLPHGQRCALVIRRFNDPDDPMKDPVVDLTLVYFPGSRASLKEKPFYDEAMRDLLYSRSQVDKEKDK